MNPYHYASPTTFYRLAGSVVPWVAWTAGILAVCGLYIGFFMAPTDFQQGEAYRIIFIHVPAAWMGMLIYVVMAFWGAIGLAFNARLASMVARAIARWKLRSADSLPLRSSWCCSISSTARRTPSPR